jgi:hypothetical protein
MFTVLLIALNVFMIGLNVGRNKELKSEDDNNDNYNPPSFCS